LLTGNTITAKEAAKIRLISEAVPDDRLDAQVNKFLKNKLLWKRICANLELTTVPTN
jgi:enoyl-CoA hydratase/carnithine racemase